MNSSKTFESDLINTLKHIEELGPVDQFIYKNQYIWPLLKIKIYFDNWALHHQMHSPSTGQSPPAAAFGLFNRMLKAVQFGVQFMFTDFKNMRFPQKCDFLFFADPFNRRITVNGKKFEIYLDPIIKKISDLGNTSVVVERNAVDRYEIPRFTKSVPQFILQIFFAPFLFKKIELSKEFLNTIETIKLQLKKAGLSTTAIEDHQLRRTLAIFELHFNMYSFLLRLCRPKYVVLTEWYSIISIALLLACKKHNIKSIEVQHGVQSQAHIAYGHFVKTLSQNYVLPFPDIFWVWSQADKNNIDQFFSKYNCRAFVGGNLFLKQVVDCELIPDGEEQIQALLKPDKKICIVTLQPIYELHSQILNFIEQHQQTYFFLIRLHPLMQSQIEDYRKKIISALPNLSFEMDRASKLPLIVLLKYSDLHITFNSSAVLESAALNVPSYIFDADLALQYFKEQLQTGRCQLYDASDPGSAKPFHFTEPGAKSEAVMDISKLFNL